MNRSTPLAPNLNLNLFLQSESKITIRSRIRSAGGNGCEVSS